LASGGSAADTHLEVDAAATTLVAVRATRSFTDGSTATGTSTRLIGVSHRSDPQHRRQHQQPCFIPHHTATPFILIILLERKL